MGGTGWQDGRVINPRKLAGKLRWEAWGEFSQVWGCFSLLHTELVLTASSWQAGTALTSKAGCSKLDFETEGCLSAEVAVASLALLSARGNTPLRLQPLSPADAQVAAGSAALLHPSAAASGVREKGAALWE